MHVLLVRFTKLNIKMSNYTCIVKPLVNYIIIDIDTISRFSKKYVVHTLSKLKIPSSIKLKYI